MEFGKNVRTTPAVCAEMGASNEAASVLAQRCRRDRLFTSKKREPCGNCKFDQLCQELGIEHRLTKPRTPRSNGMV